MCLICMHNTDAYTSPHHHWMAASSLYNIRHQQHSDTQADRQTDHDSVSLPQVFLTREYLAISMEFAQGGDLFAYTLGPNSFGKLAEVQARWIFQQLILGLDYCHRKVYTLVPNLYGNLTEVQALRML